ncbi:class I SAM-dependent methyltransferase [Aliiglaciecola sp. SL4]|uniref:class I SAM-dependent methyltransferase n=1 Tax=Aliiglaciecola sp. SL4 TaxID=3239806 RepID=UPI00355C34FE
MSSYWTDYWKQGHLTSFGEDIEDNYEGALFDCWHAYFEPIKGSNAVVIDIGTGNGALIDIAVNKVGCSNALFYGIDSAKLYVNSKVNKQNVTFYPETPAEALPFSDNSIDYVVSQFGIEYSDLDKSIVECARILKNGGKIHWVIHDMESSIVKPNSSIYTILVALQENNGPIKMLHQLIDVLEKYGQYSKEAERCRAAFNSALQQCVEKSEEGLFGTGFPRFLKEVMKKDKNFSEKKEMLLVFEREMHGQFNRLQNLLQSALSNDDKDKLVSTLFDNGFTNINSDVVIQEGKAIGYLLTGEWRPS